MFYFYGLGYGLFSLVFFIIFIGVIVVFVVQIGKGITEKVSNDNSPVLEMKVSVIDKRTSVGSYVQNDANGHMHNHHTTSNYITFEAEDGARMEFLIKDKNFGLIVVGDKGVLKFQGTRFLGFNREV